MTQEDKLLDISYRKKIIQEIKGDENVQRKIKSYKKFNMQNDNFYQYIKEYLESRFSQETVKEMSIFANINLQKRISKSESSIYGNEPERKFYIDDEIVDGMDEIYSDMNTDSTLKRANEAMKYLEQCTIQIYPEGSQLKSRVLLPQHFDVVPCEENPENACIYIISNFDNTTRDRIRRDTRDRDGFSQGETYRDQVNQTIGDFDDSNLDEERYTFWSSSYNFTTDARGNILSKDDQSIIISDEEATLDNPDVVSPLYEYQCLPFIDASKEKDFEYWVRSGDVLYDATIMYNVILTSEFQTVEMQGHAQPYYKGDAEHMPESITVGVDKMIYIPINPNNEVASEFGFANPGSDLTGIKNFRESFLASFLSSRGLDSTVISGQSTGQRSSSGIEKLLQMIEKFEASQEDFSVFRQIEKRYSKIISCWIKSLKNSNIELSELYDIAIPEDSYIKAVTEFKKPELIQTEGEKLEIAEKEIELGLSSRVHYLVDNKNMTKEQAIQHIKEVDEYESLTESKDDEVDNGDQDTDIQQTENFTEDQS